MPEPTYGRATDPSTRADPRAPVTPAEEFREDQRRLGVSEWGVRVRVLRGVTVSYGIGERPGAGYLRRAEHEGIPVARRTTGGTGVLHLEGDIAWSVLAPRTHPAVGKDFVRAYGRIGAGLVRWLGARGLPGEWRPAPGLDTDYCVLSGRGEVLTAGAKVLGGAAQHLTRSALLHQGMIARRVDPERLRRVFAIDDAVRLERLTGLDELGVRDSSAELAREIALELARDFPGPIA